MGHSRGGCTAIVKAALGPYLKYLVTWVSTAALGRYSDEVLRATAFDLPVAAIDLFSVATRQRLIEGMCASEPREQVCTIAVQAGLIFL
jgi:hypothetical protein